MEEFNPSEDGLLSDEILKDITIPNNFREIVTDSTNKLEFFRGEAQEYLLYARRIKTILHVYDITPQQSRSLFIALFLQLLKKLGIEGDIISEFDPDKYLSDFIKNILKTDIEEIQPFTRYNTRIQDITPHFSLAFINFFPKSFEEVKDNNIYLGILSMGAIYLYGRLIKLMMFWNEDKESLIKYIEEHFGLISTEYTDGTVSPDIQELVKKSIESEKIVFIVDDALALHSEFSGTTLRNAIKGVLKLIEKEKRVEIVRNIIIQITYDNTLKYNEQKSRPADNYFVFTNIGKPEKDVIIDLIN